MATFNCSLCKQDCPYVQGNVFTTSDRKFCADCYQILAQKQKERQAAQAAAAAQQQAPQPVQQTQPAGTGSVRNPPAWANRSTPSSDPTPTIASPPPEQAMGSNRNAATSRAPGFPGRQPGPGGRGAPTWANRNTVQLEQPQQDPQQDSFASPYNSNQPHLQSNSAISPRSAPTPAPTPTQTQPEPAAEEDDDIDPITGKKRRLFDKMKPQEVVVFARTHERKLQEQNKPSQQQAQPYQGGPYICSGCNTRQNGLAAACTLCGTPRPEIVRKQEVQQKKKEIDPNDPFGHITLISWDECGPQIKKW